MQIKLFAELNFIDKYNHLKDSRIEANLALYFKHSSAFLKKPSTWDFQPLITFKESISSETI